MVRDPEQERKRRELIRLVLDEGQIQGNVVRRLDIHKSTGSRWLQNERARRGNTQPAVVRRSSTEQGRKLEKENAALRKEIERLTRQNKILKRTVASLLGDEGAEAEV